MLKEELQESFNKFIEKAKEHINGRVDSLNVVINNFDRLRFQDINIQELNKTFEEALKEISSKNVFKKIMDVVSFMKPFVDKQVVKLERVLTATTTNNQKQPLESNLSEQEQNFEREQELDEDTQIISGKDEKQIKQEIKALGLSKVDEKKLLRIYTTCNFLSDLSLKIKELEDTEIPLSDLDDDESLFIKLGKAQSRFNRARKELCLFLKKNSHLREYFHDIDTSTKTNIDFMFTLRKSYAYIKFNETEYEQINREIERLINKENVIDTPDRLDILELIQEANKKYKLLLNESELSTFAEDTFKKVTSLIRKHRELDHKQIMSSHVGGTLPDDPAKNNKEIEEKLDKNKRDCELKLEKLIQEYVTKQKLKENNKNEENDESEIDLDEEEDDDDDGNDEEDVDDHDDDDDDIDEKDNDDDGESNLSDALIEDEETQEETIEEEEIPLPNKSKVLSRLPEKSSEITSNKGESIESTKKIESNESSLSAVVSVISKQNVNNQVSNEFKLINSDIESQTSKKSPTSIVSKLDLQSKRLVKPLKPNYTKNPIVKAFKRTSDIGSYGASVVKKAKQVTRKTEFQLKSTDQSNGNHDDDDDDDIILLD